MKKLQNSGIYKITTFHNDKVYIGSSKNIYKRKLDHFRDLKKECHHNQYLQRVYNKHGRYNLKFETLERNIDYDKLWEKELEYIIKYNSTEDGYNVTTPKKDDRVNYSKNYSEVRRRATYVRFYGPIIESEYQQWLKKLNSPKVLMTNKEKATLFRKKYGIPIFAICIYTNKIVTSFNSIAHCQEVLGEASSRAIDKSNKWCKKLRLVKQENYDINKDYKIKKKIKSKKPKFKGNPIYTYDLDTHKVLINYNNKNELAIELNCNVKYITRVLSNERPSYKGLGINFTN